jgi:hydrogenase-4 component B
MPRTFLLFSLGAIAICGLPPLNGFVSELVLYAGLLRATGADPPHAGVWAGLAAPALAMIGALAVAAFVKVVGVAFGGTPRSGAAAHAQDPGPAMLAPMAALAAGCVVLGLVPGLAAPLLRSAVSAWDPALGNDAPRLATLAPLGWASAAGWLLIASVALVAALVRWRPPARAGVTWDCGYASPTPRMQYVDASFSETLVGLFHWAVRSRRAPPALPGPFPPPSRFSSEVPDAVLDRVVLPLLGAADRGLSRVRVLQRGPVQMYLLYVLLAVVVLLLVAR